MNLKKINTDFVGMMFDKKRKNQIGFMILDDEEIFISTNVMFYIIKREDCFIDFKDRTPFRGEYLIKEAEDGETAYLTNTIEIYENNQVRKVETEKDGRFEWIDPKLLKNFDLGATFKLGTGHKHNILYIYENDELVGGVLPVNRGGGGNHYE